MAGKRAKSKKRVKKKHQIEMTSLSIFLWTFFLFFLLAWIFVLGIFVGRGFLPGSVSAVSELKGQMARLQEMIGRNHVRDKEFERRSEPDPKLAFYEKLSSKKSEAKKQWLPENEEKIPKKEDKPEKIKSEKERSANTSERGTREASSEPSEPLIDDARYTVQVASLGEKEKAEKMINRLIGQGYDAYYYEVKVKGKTYYRVRCGRFVSRKEAVDHAGRLAKEAGIKGFVSRIE